MPQNIITFLDWVGRITVVIFLITLFLAIYAWFKGIIPAMLRLGNGLAKRKIAIFAKGDNFNSLRNLLIDSKIFSKNNILQISRVADIGSAEQATVYLVYWSDWQSNINKILQSKKDQTAMIIYAQHASIPQRQMSTLDTYRNVTVTNFRGRLLNDITASMITTSWK